ncbi:DUF4239 domain-containing protein [Streptomyces sp. TLI_146]|uniref:bestrophin-like domain n=1 Tax=Streptomyces sp. TLI_146 TaxID=1938858 RepID=UPI000CC94558|nr:DUF4239 domain-containing protein [Streptomyces sp. TLI_146]PKV90082.1 uncharacterized protein DUF4239 [Streptomyces sp. TLI_146]
MQSEILTYGSGIFAGTAAIVCTLIPHAKRAAWKSATLLIGGAVVLTDSLIPVVRRCFNGQFTENDQALLGGGLSLVGTLFALIIGFVVVVVWQSLTETEGTVAREANALADLERMSRGFEVQIRRQVQGAVRTYARLVVSDEWPAMAAGSHSVRANAALVELWTVYTTMSAEQRGTHLYAQSLIRLNELGDARRTRLLSATSRIPVVMWLLIAVDAIGILALSVAFGLSETWQMRLIMATLVASVAFAVFLVAELDGPFSGDLCVSAEAFAFVTSNMQDLED